MFTRADLRGGLAVAFITYLSLHHGALLGQTPWAYEVQASPLSVQLHQPLSVEIRALGPDGQTLTDWGGEIDLLTFLPSSPSPVISELRTDFGASAIEIANPARREIDITGWRFETYEDRIRATPNVTLVFPAGSVLPAGGTAVWSTDGTPPGAFPRLIAPDWSTGDAVRLIDSTGQRVDEVYLHYRPPFLSQPLWTGAALGNSTLSSTLTRRGAANHFHAADWSLEPPTLGEINPGLVTPWEDTGTWLRPLPDRVTFVRGVWAGTVETTRSGNPVYLVAADSSGLSGRSASLEILPLPKLSLLLEGGLPDCSESTAGLAGQLVVGIPAARALDTTILLEIADTNEFVLAPRVVIPAGSLSVSLTVTNLDDTRPDGTARVALSASATGFQSATAWLYNEDNEPGTLHVFPPLGLAEASGLSDEPGRVFLEAPASHDVVVRLTADPPLEVPGTIVILAGQSSAPFEVRVGANDVVDPSPWDVAIRATTPGWPTATARCRVLDDDDPGYDLLLPESVVEGSPAVGRVRFKTPHAQATRIELGSLYGYVKLPPEVTLEPGALEAAFELVVPDNDESGWYGQETIWAQVPGIHGVSGNTIAYDDEVAIDHLLVDWLLNAYVAGDPLPLTIMLAGFGGVPQQTNTTAHLDLLGAGGLAQLSPDSQSVQLIGGVWKGVVRFEGAASGVRLRVTAANQVFLSAPFTILAGHILSLELSDFAWDPAGQRLLALTPPDANTPESAPRLLEIDPETGLPGRSLELPQVAARIAISDDGSLAWLASSADTLQRIDLVNWTVAGVFEADPTATSSEIPLLAVVPGQPEQVLAVIGRVRAGTPGTVWSMALFDHGAILAHEVALPQGGRQVSDLLLSPAGHPAYVLTDEGNTILELELAAAGLTLAKSVAEPPFTYYGASTLSWLDGKLYRGDGTVFATDQDLSPLGRLPVFYSAMGCAVPEQNAMLFLTTEGDLQRFDVATGELTGSHGLPHHGFFPGRLVRWGSGGLGMHVPQFEELTLFTSPMLAAVSSDLRLTVQAPEFAEQDLCGGYGGAAEWDWEFAVTNHGPGTAEGVVLTLSTGETHPFGTLLNGQGARCTVHRTGNVGVHLAQATLRCLGTETAPDDNSATVVTRVRANESSSTRQLIFGMTDLAASPAGDRLAVSVARSAGDVRDGVAIIDPDTATVERFLPVGSDPHRLVFTDDGALLYVQLGTNRLVRWNLSANQPDLQLTFPDQTLFQVIPVPGSHHAFVAATSSRTVVMDDNLPRPQSVEGQATERWLGWADGELWIAEPGQLLPSSLAADGLHPLSTPISYTPASGSMEFVSDGARLCFAGEVYDTDTRTVVAAMPWGLPCVDTSHNALFVGDWRKLVRYQRSSLTPQAEQLLVETFDFPSDPVRWGADGLAVRTPQQQLLILRSPLVPRAVDLDLAISVAAPDLFRPYATQDWTVTITNRSGVVVPRTLLFIEFDGGFRDLEVLGLPTRCFSQTHTADLTGLGPGQSLTLLLRGWTLQTQNYLTLRTLSSANLLKPEDATVSVTAYPLLAQAHVKVAVAAPSNPVTPGVPFTAPITVLNTGPDKVSLAYLRPALSPGLEILSWSAEDHSTTTNAEFELGALAMGQSRTVEALFLPRSAGLLAFKLSAYGDFDDYDSAHAWDGAVVYAPVPDDGVTPMLELNAPAPRVLAYDASRDEVLAAFPDHTRNLLTLDPETFQPRQRIALPEQAEFVAPAQDGIHAWISFAGGAGMRVNLRDGTSTAPFPYHSSQSPVHHVTAVPGHPETLVVALTPGFGGNTVLRCFDNGIARPADYGPLGWSGGGVSSLFTPDGRLFVASSQLLRELALSASGFTEIRNLDALSVYSGNSLSFASDRLFYLEGRVVDLDTATADDSLHPRYPLVADVTTGLAYSSDARLQARAADTLRLLWSFDWPNAPWSGASLGSLGQHGLFILADRLALVRPNRFDPRTTDLAIGATAPSETEVTAAGFILDWAVTNRSSWTAQDTTLAITLTDGLWFGPDSGAEGLQVATFSLGDLERNAASRLLIVANTAGPQAITLELRSSTPESNPADNIVQQPIHVLAPPLCFIDHFQMPEGARHNHEALQAWLSRPTPEPLYLDYTITPITAQADDFHGLQGQVFFFPGSDRATVVSVRDDIQPEFDETAVVDFNSSQVALFNPSINLTLLNDDWPVVQITPLTLPEGNVGTGLANLSVRLSPTAPFPVEARFGTTPLSATPHEDYEPRTGWLRFEPGQSQATFVVPYHGDTVLEPSETVQLTLLQVEKGLFGGAGGLLTLRNDDPVPAISIRRRDPATLSVVADTAPGLTYRLESVTNLTRGNWTVRSAALQGTGNPVAFDVPASTNLQTYFRVMAQ